MLDDAVLHLFCLLVVHSLGFLGGALLDLIKHLNSVSLFESAVLFIDGTQVRGVVANSQLGSIEIVKGGDAASGCMF